ncbi:MAG: hypothetical protein AUJ92_06160 [Armatimonadetes bacterium CG2_30_59_28]|nr:DUF2007 domain-containing protein [Armatimonadota bacterium]OIO96378.1 MAG: hypothetical protein AUJ92_06160 [Armatimonadetes bacterium CG2_30_59_28]PIU66475.1 MAG: hypothetical protein COS85_04715 [Armatimonadetes bacterium CG07_land_8_20_14_0_80_59_28]PIX41538.1 MAG: hypothetical protein COZ56_11780 [Armatimonadetes bacterium CG_4_8_14_3_um_filter_58_9]PIY48731.1 MAG: hypothetical protein COZ05_02380 [Armatimonadetes bacterium CG_4_10_14_3_um_filter_59_10]
MRDEVIVRACEVENEIEAVALRDHLEANGIPAMVRSTQIPSYVGPPILNRPWGEVLVRKEDATQARDLINIFYNA